MSLTQQIERLLHIAGTGPKTLDAHEDNASLTCKLVAIDGLGVSMQRLELQSQHLRGLSVDKLHKAADDLATRVSYLLEALGPVEVDDEACTIQMRSIPPYRAENTTSYYEVLVTAGTISLCRYSKSSGTVRHTEPFDITRQVLFRLIDDFTATASGI